MRSDLHVYHCPAGTLKNNLIDSQVTNCETLTNGLTNSLNGTLNGNLTSSLSLNGNHINHQNHSIYNGSSLCSNSTCTNQTTETANYFHLDTDCKESIITG